jgi:predicted secreted protein
MRPLHVLLLPCLLAACVHHRSPANASEPARLSAADAPEVVAPAAQGPTVLAVGQVLEIALQGNAGTGYAWELVEDGAPRLVRAVPPPRQEDGAPADPPLVGAATTTLRWRFRAVEPGQARIRLVYRRPWEQGVAPLREAVFDVVAAP